LRARMHGGNLAYRTRLRAGSLKHRVRLHSGNVFRRVSRFVPPRVRRGVKKLLGFSSTSS